MTDSNGRPDGSPDLAPGSSYEVPVVTASLSRRALRERQEPSSVLPVVETRRERRERELAAASALSSVASEMPAARESGAAAPVARTRRDIRGLEHLLRAPAAAGEDAAAVPATTAAPAAAAATTAAPATAATAATAVTAATTATQATSAPQASTAMPATSATPASITFSRADEIPARPRISAPREALASISSSDRGARRSVVPRLRRTGGSPRPASRKRAVVNSAVMVATAGLVATLALPAYAYTDPNGLPRMNVTAASQLGIQQLTVDGVNGQSSTRDDYSTTGNVAEMDSTMGTSVSPTVQALAAELMADVASGKLVGSVPDHIVEIRNLANGVAVPGCGVDYRVLQTIKVAVDNFDKVGVSDINRHCTGQIEGAGTASSHYKDGGGHAVDFYILNGHGLTGADSDSLKLIGLLDPLVPKGSGLGQSECGRSISVSNFAPFPDTCTHMHVDFGNAQGVALKSS